MKSNIIVFGWNRSIPGHERERSNLVVDFNCYLGQQVDNGTIESYQVLFPDIYGGDTNGIFIIYGSEEQLDALCKSKNWDSHVTHASLHVDNLSIVRGTTNEIVMERVDVWHNVLRHNVEVEVRAKN